MKVRKQGKLRVISYMQWRSKHYRKVGNIVYLLSAKGASMIFGAPDFYPGIQLNIVDENSMHVDKSSRRQLDSIDLRSMGLRRATPEEVAANLSYQEIDKSRIVTSSDTACGAIVISSTRS